MLRHTRLGNGPPLVLLHGTGSRRQLWEPLFPLITPARTVYAIDLPGFGESAGTGAATVPLLADEVAAFLTAEGITRPVVGGSSLGGGIALELGRRGLAAAVVGFSPIGFTTGAWARAVLAGVHATGTALTPLLPLLMSSAAGRTALCGLFYGRPASLSPEVCLADARAMIAAPGFEAARRALGDWRLTSPRGLRNIPVTIAWGSRDRILFPCQALVAREVLSSARHIALPGAGHLPFHDRTAQCANLLLHPG